MSAQSRKRNRRSLSCLFCKKRKVKCDKGHPCSTCTKYNSECVYETAVKVAKTQPTNNNVYDELELLKEKLASLEDSFKEVAPKFSPPTYPFPTRDSVKSNTSLDYFGYNPAEYGDTINFFGGPSPILIHNNSRRNFGPLSWFMMMRTDTAMQKLWELKKHTKKMQKLLIFQVDGKLSEQTAKVYKRKLQQSFGESEELRPFVSTVREETSTLIKVRKLAKSKINERAKSLGLMFYEGGFEEELELVDKIDLVLPPRKVIWKLIDRFFVVLYPLFPLLDEEDFQSKLTPIIGSRDEVEERVTLKVSKKLDFIYLGTLLTVLRLTFLTLFSNSTKDNEANLVSNDPSPQVQEIKYLLNNTISIDCIDVAEMCLDLFNLSRNCLFPLLQLAIFLKCYRIYSPEDSEMSDYNNTGSSIYTGTLLQMAYSMGLNREPDIAIGPRPDLAKQNNLARKMWYFLLILDLNTAVASGAPVQTHPLSFDTKTPFYATGNSNIKDTEREKIIVELYSKVDKNLHKVTELMNLIINVKGETDLTELCSKLDLIELGFTQVHGSLSHFVRSESVSSQQVVERGIQMKIYFLSMGFIISVYFHIFNHYEQKKNRELTYFYLKKMLFIAIHEMLPYYNMMVDNTSEIFRDSTDIVITPLFLSVVHKSLILLESLYLRARFTIDELESSPNHTNNINLDVEYQERFKSLRIFQGLCSSSIKILFETIGKLSNRYFYAWRMLKAGSFVWKTLQDGEVFERYKNDRVTFDMSTEMINEINALMTHSLDIYETLNVRNGQQPATQENDATNDPWEKSSVMNGNAETPGFGSKMSPFPFTDGMNTELPRHFTIGSEMEYDSSFPGLNNFGNMESSREVDDLWFQMMSLKQDSSAPHFSLFDNPPTVSESLSTNGSNSAAPSGLDLDSLNGSLDKSQVSPNFLISTLPFDELFRKV